MTIIARYHEKFRNISHDMLWTLLGTVVSRGLVILTTYFCARFLSLQDMAQWMWLSTTVTTFTIFASHSLGMGATKYVAASPDPSTQRAYSRASLYITLIMSGAMTVALLPFSGFIAQSVFNYPSAKWAVTFTVLTIPLMSIVGALQGTLVGLGKFYEIAHFNFWTSTATIILVIGGAVLGQHLSGSGLTGATAGFLLGSIIQAIWMYIVARSVLTGDLTNAPTPQLHGVPRKTVYHQLLTYAIPIFIAGIAFQGGPWLASTLLASRKDMAADFAVLQLAIQWQIMILFLPTLLGRVMLRHYAKGAGETQSQDAESSHEWVKLGLVVSIASTLIPSVVVALLSKYILAFYRPEYAVHAWAFTAVILSSVVLSMAFPPHRKLMMAANPWFIVACDAVYSITLVSLSWHYIDKGASGYAIIRVGGAVLYFVCVMGLYWVKVKPTSPPVASTPILPSTDA